MKTSVNYNVETNMLHVTNRDTEFTAPMPDDTEEAVNMLKRYLSLSSAIDLVISIYREIQEKSLEEKIKSIQSRLSYIEDQLEKDLED